MGAYLVLFPRAEITTIVPIFFIGAVMEVPATIIIGFWAVLQFANAYWLKGGGMQGGGVAYMAHVGGFLAGAVLINLFKVSITRDERMLPANECFDRDGRVTTESHDRLILHFEAVVGGIAGERFDEQLVQRDLGSVALHLFSPLSHPSGKSDS